MIDRQVLQPEIISELIDNFGIKEKYNGYIRINVGHINDTFKVCCHNKNYIFQRINTSVFKNIDGLIKNIADVTAYIRDKINAENSDERNEVLNILQGKDGKYCYTASDGAIYRIYDFIENAISYSGTYSPEIFKESAVAFAKFQRYLSGYPVEKITDSIPDFHNTAKRYEAFEAAVKRDIAGRRAEVEDLIAFVRKRKAYKDTVVDKLADGSIPVRVTHNDTKLNNVMIDRETGKGVCVIDLDTIMKGSLLYDFGDSVRFGCNTANESETDLDKVEADTEMFKAYVRGYLSVMKDTITSEELELLAFSGILMTYECGMRFLTDYLEGDVYFRVDEPLQNLHRARNQFKLVEDMEKKLKLFNRIVADTARDLSIGGGK